MMMSIMARWLASRTQGLHWNPIRSRRILPILLLALLTSCSVARADTQDPDQKRSHAVTTMVVGIISYARWPAQPDPIRLCVTASAEYAEGLFDPVLLTAPRPIKALRIELSDPQLATSCDVVYLGEVNTEQKQEFINRITGHSILSISEKDMECAVGSAFCLQISNDQTGFKVNLDALARSGVRVHPNVLQLARKKVPQL
nr:MULTISPECIES: YfiR family protein [unclassified Serratia (in: enterobacteria)]